MNTELKCDGAAVSGHETYVIICAAGIGSRFGGELPKQFCDMGGEPVLMRTVRAMRAACPGAVTVTVVSDCMRGLWLDMCASRGFESGMIVSGGETRWHSVRNALMAIAPEAASDARVLVHDGARPVVPGEVVDGVISALDAGHAGAVPAVAVTDSLVMTVGDAGCFEPVERARYRAVQTPQGFNLTALLGAYVKMGYRETFTDDASVMRASGVDDVVLTPGSAANIKITNPQDIAAALLHGR